MADVVFNSRFDPDILTKAERVENPNLINPFDTTKVVSEPLDVIVDDSNTVFIGSVDLDNDVEGAIVLDEILADSMEQAVIDTRPKVGNRLDDGHITDLTPRLDHNSIEDIVLFNRPTSGVSDDPRFAPDPVIPANSRAPFERTIREVIPATLLAIDESDRHNRIAEAMAGRYESDIPLTDDYWKIKEKL